MVPVLHLGTITKIIQSGKRKIKKRDGMVKDDRRNQEGEKK